MTELLPFSSPGRRASLIVGLAIVGIAIHLVFRWVGQAPVIQDIPLYVVLAAGGIPLVFSLAVKLVRGQFGSDLLAGISIVAAVLLGQYLAGSLVVLMLSGGEALEEIRSRARVLGSQSSRATDALCGPPARWQPSV